MKFIHIADMHFDTSFTTLTTKSDLGDIRRLDQRNVFRKVIDYIKENNIPYLFIAGDFYEHKYIRQSTIEFINDLFKQIPDTAIFITPGNHDPYLNNSFYNKYYWNDNVHIFSPEIRCIELKEMDIYGWGFGDFCDSNLDIENIKIKNKDKINVLITHGTLNGSNTMERMYNPISKNKIEELGFDYIALGHIHKTDYNTVPNQKIVYPGSLISMGFDELGNHGMVVGNLQKNKVTIQFISLDNKEFKVVPINITNRISIDEIAEELNALNINENIYYKIELVGQRNFEIEKTMLEKLVLNKNIIKIKDLTSIGYDIQKIAKENTLRGLFAKEILDNKEEANIDLEVLEKAFEIGLEVLDK